MNIIKKMYLKLADNFIDADYYDKIEIFLITILGHLAVLAIIVWVIVFFVWFPIQSLIVFFLLALLVLLYFGFSKLAKHLTKEKEL